jgi:2-C-methyl-D-erythritol 2,4-cyclodiphosphate synthase
LVIGRWSSVIAMAVTRVGVGLDMHRLVPGRALILGGVGIPFERGLEGDSDADVLTHAILDALLGAAGAGDIGAHFGVGRPEMRGISSLVLLERVVMLIAARGYRPSNVDATVIAEAPKIGPHIPAMRERLAAVLRIPPDRVNVKGTTAKGLGWLGAGEGVAVIAVASVTAVSAGRPGVSSHRIRRGRERR